MVVVLPWHDPLRVAEEVSMLDAISDGRLILGLGRGAGKVEFDGFRLSMDESRDRFVESAQMLLRGLETGYVEFDGRYVKQPQEGHPSGAVQVVPRPHLRGGGVAGVGADHGGARRRHAHHSRRSRGGKWRRSSARTARSTAR